MPSIAEIRSQFPDATAGKTDWDIVNDFAKANKLAPETMALRLGAELPDAPGFVSGLQSGLGSTVEGVGRAIDDYTDGQPGALTRYGRYVQQMNPTGAHSVSAIADNPRGAAKESEDTTFVYVLPILTICVLYFCIRSLRRRRSARHER